MNPATKMYSVEESRPFSERRSAGGASVGMWRVVWLSLLLTLPFGQAWAQSQGTGTDQLSEHPMRPPDSVVNQMANADERSSGYDQKRARQLNVALHKSMVSDTDKLLQLVTELNAEISNTNSGSLTPEQLRMVAEIEKLAHSVKDKMRTSAPAPPSFMDTTTSITDPSRR